MNRLKRLLAAAVFLPLLLLAVSGCDMSYIQDPLSFDRSDSPPAPEARLEHYLLLRRLPANTERETISAVKITDGTAQVAGVPDYGSIVIARDSGFSDVYIPLAAPSGAGFARTGIFYVEFTVRIDALTRIVVRSEHKVLVEFTEGKGVLDVEELTAQSPDAVDAVSHYLLLRHLPANTDREALSAVNVTDGAAPVARVTDYGLVTVAQDSGFSSVYIPLAAPSGAGFT
ncbi:MAG: hypothetical protein LBP27_00745, partial [Treponema sp.]|nr:hypothetical protein [Treponema sp.]